MDKVAKDVRDKLLKIARNGSTTNYKEIGRAVGLHWRSRHLLQALDAVNRHEHSEGRPLLTAVVVNAERRRPGNGFFILAETWGLFDPAKDDERGFWKQELQRVYSYWAP